MHRIILFQPTSKDSPEKKSTYYYGEVMCNRQHFGEIGLNYLEIFKGSLAFDLQVDPEIRQRSRLCLWHPYYEDSGSYLSFDSYCEGEYCLPVLFQDPEPPSNLTADFCPWSREDGLGSNYLLDRLFSDGERTRESFTCFLDKDSENGSSSNGIGGLFNSENLNEYECQEATCDEDIIEEQSEITSDSQVGDVKDMDDVSQPSFIPQFLLYSSKCKNPMRLCYVCNQFTEIMLDHVNKEMYPDWKWVFLQTRWPLRFAPQQLVDLSTDDILLPPWRVSASRLLHDVCQYCNKNPHLENLVLLDPMSLSPLSPLINLMQLNATQDGKLTGILWMTPYQALSPFFQVPVSTNNCPSPITIRYLTLNAFITNWVSWISRIEVYSSLGFSRPLPKYITDSVAAHILQPFSLGCGGTPLIDLWPLWSFRSILKLFLRLPMLTSCITRSFTSSGSRSTRNTYVFFPFTDMDEI
ncbi:unnamed protein product [Hymenolepis diminuta]|nr:unnamed protein product [Hymenolepis diminuta]